MRWLRSRTEQTVEPCCGKTRLQIGFGGSDQILPKFSFKSFLICDDAETFGVKRDNLPIVPDICAFFFFFFSVFCFCWLCVLSRQKNCASAADGAHDVVFLRERDHVIFATTFFLRVVSFCRSLVLFSPEAEAKQNGTVRGLTLVR